ncbi:flagellar biosynthesis protein FlhF [Schinkia azotoformans]|uniref:Flagellar biosynthesis protein FlhF n=1 Tax=Schinkia azotoformans LMG 9581 TaxID=1131731 RepID=K6DSZ3_SCHAZ|nr:flagellar biosynthesis protein FlhF [Schinkia azotoformans]EKN63901.1 flagellar biosynthesis regulator FlhF [Schinkia azotoformans LMG 9581]MEC1638235.1 flagellar biosynthesis protein FlhF [Schinkia azotoformans]MEC1721877.1 flagellar biosynthesis protein FlhF [Schinkia azotoformans]MEC1946331.1 flagellar biosynthesis protein FlhF [Schinkia azotoformans]MED4351821.1 flagellar biosynthesis protein FlhF [Schinkia azotoformans]
MKVKKFIAPNMPEAMKMIRNELGKDAVILNSKVVQKGGIFGFFTKKNIEVIAAVDPQPIPKKQPMQKEKIEPKIEFQPAPIIKSVEVPKTDAELLKEIKDLKEMLKGLSVHNGRDSFEHYPGPLKDMNQFLSNQEVDLQLRKEIMGFLLEKWYVNKGEANFEQITTWGKEYLVNSMSPLSFGAINFSKKYINVVGPTGVGKTTTLAKIAAQAVLKYGKKVAFITTDTYRIAAIDQLKTYAKILNVPLEVTYTIDDFVKAKERFSHFDLILIDTAGRNFRNKQYVEDLKSVISFDENLETILVLALTSKYSDMLDIFEQFSSIKIDKLIFTKVDETSKYGTILNLIFKYKIGVAYLTNGQNVPDDIFEASPESIANTVFGVNRHERSS